VLAAVDPTKTDLDDLATSKGILLAIAMCVAIWTAMGLVAITCWQLGRC
jgi:hypothetical protein